MPEENKEIANLKSRAYDLILKRDNITINARQQIEQINKEIQEINQKLKDKNA